MSWEALSWASKQLVGSSTDKIVLITLANFADENGECYPSHKKISSIAECSVQTVIRSLHRLEDKGFIIIKPRFQQLDDNKARQTSNLYKLFINTLSQKKIGGEYQIDKGEGGQNVTPINSNNNTVNINNNIKISFETFWIAYPKRPNNNKHGAFLKYKEAIKEITPEKLLEATDKFRKTQLNVEGKFIPHAKTWLNQKRYFDEYTVNEDNVVSYTRKKQLTYDEVVNASDFYKEFILRDADKCSQITEMLKNNIIKKHEIEWFNI